MNKFITILIIFLYFVPPALCYENDFIVDEFLANKKIEKPVLNNNYNY